MAVTCPIAAKAPSEGVVMSFCRECGNQLREDAQFCVKCGTKAWEEQPTATPEAPDPAVAESTQQGSTFDRDSSQSLVPQSSPAGESLTDSTPGPPQPQESHESASTQQDITPPVAPFLRTQMPDLAPEVEPPQVEGGLAESSQPHEPIGHLGDQEVVPETPRPTFCTNCGTLLSTTAQFCGQCGTKVASQ